jgi:PPOX class probable F420-dependent enzyme
MAGGRRTLSDEEARLFLGRNFGWLAATRPDGTPQLTVIWVDWDGGHVVFNVADTRVKLRYLEANPAAVVAVYDHENPYRWVRVEGITVSFESEGAREHIDALHRKYRGGDRYPLPPGEQRVTVRVRPERVTAKL